MSILDTVRVLKTSGDIGSFLKDVEELLIKNQILCIGMDFEFDNKNNKHEMSMGQISIYDHDIDMLHIALYDLRRFNDQQKELYISIITSDVPKILHGSESLDMPAMYAYIGDLTLSTKFIMSTYDTLFYCQIYQILKAKAGLKPNTKCNIYDALYDVNIMDKKEYTYFKNYRLNYRQDWKIDTIESDKKRFIYAMADVMPLGKLLASYADVMDSNIMMIVRPTYVFAYEVRHNYRTISSKIKKDSQKISQDAKAIDSYLESVIGYATINDQKVSFTMGDLMKIDYFRKPLMQTIAFLVP